MPRRNTPDHSYFDSVITQLELSVVSQFSDGRKEYRLSDKEGKSCSIVCDQLGMPTEAYDEEGKAPMMRVVIRREFDVAPKAQDECDSWWGICYPSIPDRHPPYDTSISKGFKRRRQKVCLLSYNRRPRLGGILVEVFNKVGTLDISIEEVVESMRLFPPVTITPLGIRKGRWRRIGKQENYNKEQDSMYSDITLVSGAEGNYFLWRGA